MSLENSGQQIDCTYYVTRGGFSQDFFGIFKFRSRSLGFGIFRISHSGFFRDFSEILMFRSRSRDFGIFYWGFYRVFQIPTPIPGFWDFRD